MFVENENVHNTQLPRMGNVCLANVTLRYFLQHTVLTRLNLFNAGVLELQAGNALVGRNLNA